MALETFVAGRYTNTYSGVDTGATDDDGYQIEQGSSAEVIDQTDAWGGSAVDLIFRGGLVNLSFTAKAYKAGSISPFWPWGALGVMATPAAPIGRLGSAVASPDVLTAVANTPAAAAPASLTANLAILAPNQSSRLLFTSKLRNVPIRLMVLPFDSGGTVRWFTLT